ncbi:MAG: hypothetical protein AAF378_10600 [Cyanobacteria bacterium P01_A01_bin.84]
MNEKHKDTFYTDLWTQLEETVEKYGEQWRMKKFSATIKEMYQLVLDEKLPEVVLNNFIKNEIQIIKNTHGH